MVRNNKGACGGANGITNRAPVYRSRLEWLMRAMGFALYLIGLYHLPPFRATRGQPMARTATGGVSLVG
jgi:hypothetical protein